MLAAVLNVYSTLYTSLKPIRSALAVQHQCYKSLLDLLNMCVKSRKVNKLPPWAFEELANSSDDEMMSFTLLSAKECQKQHEDELCRRARNIQVPLSRPDGISVSKVFTGMYSQIEFCPSEDEDEFEWRKVPLSGEQADIQKKWEQTHNKKYYQTRKAKLAREKEHAEWLAERAKKEALEERAKMRARLALEPGSRSYWGTPP